VTNLQKEAHRAAIAEMLADLARQILTGDAQVIEMEAEWQARDFEGARYPDINHLLTCQATLTLVYYVAPEVD